MKTYHIAVFLLICLVNLSILSPVSAEESYTVSFAHRPPHVIFNKDTATISGALYDFLNEEIAPVMGVTFVWDQDATNITRSIEYMESGERDITALLAFTTERAEKLTYSKSHFYASKPAVALLKENPLNKVTKIEDLIDLTIGYVDNTHITPFMRDPRIKFDFVSAAEWVKINLKKMEAHRVDAVYTPSKSTLMWEIKKESLEAKIKVLELPEPDSKNHVAFAKKHADLAKRYDAAFVKVGGHRKYSEKLGKYIDTSAL